LKTKFQKVVEKRLQWLVTNIITFNMIFSMGHIHKAVIKLTLYFTSHRRIVGKIMNRFLMIKTFNIYTRGESSMY